MKFTNSLLEKYGIDKVLHFICGAWITLIPSVLGPLAVLIAFFLMLLASMIKESFLDEKFDFYDIVASFCGGVVSMIFFFFFYLC